MSAHERHELHVNSLLAWYEGREDLFGKREVAVLKMIERMGRATAREVMLALEFKDMNAVRPRISELVKADVLEEVGSKTDPVTGKSVAIFALRRDPRKAQREFAFGDDLGSDNRIAQ